MQKRKWGFPTSQDASGTFNEFLLILVSADNFWINAKSPNELQQISTIWFSRCAFSGWSIPHRECSWSTTMSGHACRRVLNVEGHTIERISKGDGIKVLACIISCSGSMDLELAARISSAWGPSMRIRRPCDASRSPLNAD